MDEQYRLGGWDYLSIEAHGEYSNFRKFSVEVQHADQEPELTVSRRRREITVLVVAGL